MARRSCSSQQRKKSEPISKTLIQKRISMLEEDDDEHDDHVPIPLASAEQPRQPKRHTLDDDKSPANPNKHLNGSRRAKKQRLANKAASNNPTKNKPGGQRMDKNRKLLAARAMERALQVQANLSTQYPSFVKSMMRSHVTQGFWLGLPKSFCDDHLPIRDTEVVLVDEDGNSSKATYLADKFGLSAGWRGFSIEHNLQEGDAVVYHLIGTAKFKVYIVRKAESGEAREQGSENHAQGAFKAEDKVPPLTSVSPVSSNVDLEVEVTDGIRLSDSVIKFEALEGYTNFSIIYNGLILDSKFSDSIKENYYQLCRCHKSILHDRLLKGLNIILVVGIISETINIADAIRASDASTSHNDLQNWDRTLKCFQLFGMDVAFLRAQLGLLLGSVGMHTDGSEEGPPERAPKRGRMRGLEDMFSQLKVKMSKVGSKIEAEIAASARRGQD